MAAGAALGLGAATKLYPALLVVPLIAQRLRERRPDGAIVLGWTAVGAWLAVNLPFAVLAPTAWLTFFRFNGERTADFDSLWYIACRHTEVCLSTRAINVWSFAIFLAVSAAVWAIKARRHPGFPRWTLGLPLLVVFLLSNKVYSPQYGLWLLPWFALVLPRLWLFLAFSVADVAVFVTRFTWFGRLQGAPGASQELFEVMVLLRAAVLVWCVVTWIRREAEPLEIETRRPRRRPRGRAARRGGAGCMAETAAAPVRLRDGVRDALLVFLGVRIGFSLLGSHRRRGHRAAPGGARRRRAGRSRPSRRAGGCCSRRASARTPRGSSRSPPAGTTRPTAAPPSSRCTR